MRVLELEEVSYRRLWSITILILMYMSMAIGMCFIYFVFYLLSPVDFFPQGLWWAGLIVLTFAAAVASGFGAYPDMWDERSQVEKRAGELGNEIENLKKKVQARLHKSIAA